jgi:G:T-mismatch repair DNA endonuclease (very short patch repair protein)
MPMAVVVRGAPMAKPADLRPKAAHRVVKARAVKAAVVVAAQALAVVIVWACAVRAAAVCAARVVVVADRAAACSAVVATPGAGT